MKELYIKNKDSILRLLTTTSSNNYLKITLSTNKPKSDYEFLRRIGAKRLSFQNGKGKIACSIPKDILSKLDVFSPTYVNLNALLS